MAGTPSGLEPNTPRLRLVPSTSRTRRCHGVFIAGDELAVVYSSRRGADCSVSVDVGTDVVERSWSITPSQARAMARAMIAAADAVDRHVVGLAAGNLAASDAVEQRPGGVL